MKNEAIEGEKKGPGQPAFFSSAEELQAKIDEYYESCKTKVVKADKEIEGSEDEIVYGEPLTITGLAYFLGFESRQSFYDYEKRPEFSYIIKRARFKVESGYEANLHGKSPVGSIFALKNMGWTDKQEFDHTSGGEKIQGPPPINVYSGSPPFAGSEDEVEQTKDVQ